MGLSREHTTCTENVNNVPWACGTVGVDVVPSVTCPLDPDFIQKGNLSHLQFDRCGVAVEGRTHSFLCDFGDLSPNLRLCPHALPLPSWQWLHGWVMLLDESPGPRQDEWRFTSRLSD